MSVDKFKLVWLFGIFLCMAEHRIIDVSLVICFFASIKVMLGIDDDLGLVLNKISQVIWEYLTLTSICWHIPH